MVSTAGCVAQSCSPVASALVAVAEIISTTDLIGIVRSFREALAAHRELINRLNVYPVPDGDTGTNMTLTIGSVLEELDGLDEGDSDDRAAVCKAISHGSLMGARGNSGVILSQVLRGLASSFAEVPAIDGPAFASAMTQASIAADAAVMRPVEGTILTVVRESARGAREAHGTLVDVLEASLHAGEVALAHTPEQLQVLKEAGVVDAGGAGFVLLLHAALHMIDGRPLPDVSERPEMVAVPIDRPDHHDAVSELRYEVMYLLDADDDLMGGFKDVWAGLGDSIVVVGGDGLWNCHIHTDDIGPAIEAAIDIGRPRQIRVTDLAEEVLEEQWVREAAAAGGGSLPSAEPVPCAVVAVSPAAGIARIFHSLGVQELVVGGQTMNPSTAELLEAVERAPGPHVVILPNNSNIVAVAQRVDAETGKTVCVVPTRSVPEGFASLLAYDPQADASANAEAMSEVAGSVVVGEVTQAVRDTSSSAGSVREGDWIGLDRDGVRSIGAGVAPAAISLLDQLIDAEHEILTVIEGEGAGDADTRTITEWLHATHPSVEAEVHHGGQEHYPYLFGIE